MCEDHTHESAGVKRRREGVGCKAGIAGDCGRRAWGSLERGARGVELQQVSSRTPHHLVDGRTRLEHVVEARNRRLDDHGHVAVTQLSEALDAALGLQDRHHLTRMGKETEREGGGGELSGIGRGVRVEGG